MKHLRPILMIILLLGCTPGAKKTNDFRLHLFVEPQQLDPAKGRSSSASYFFFNVMRGLYIYNSKKGIIPEGGNCLWKSEKLLNCKLNEKYKWSNGDPITAQDYQRAFFHLADPKTAAPRAHLLKSIVNASDIIKGQKPPTDLGVSIIDDFNFQISFTKEDPEFIYKLTSTALFPKHKDSPKNKLGYKKFLSSGPYKIKDWKSGQQIFLEKNEHYPNGHPDRPNVTMYIIDSDLTAYRLYERGQLNFLRRALPRFVEKLKDRDDFYRIPQARFDYIGFGEPLNKNLQLRKALALSIDYQASIKVLEALGPLGCPSIPKSWLDTQPCYSFNIKEAKKTLALVSPEVLKQKIVYNFSMLGGAVLKKQAEFLQNQWKKNLGLQVELRMTEQKMYLKNLKVKPPSMFRKGVGLDRASCSDALDTFTKNGPENYMKWSDRNYEEIIDKIMKEKNARKRKILCRQGIEILMNEYRVIPLGEMHFTILARPQFRGWRLNELNQLDLSQLHLVKP